MNTTVTQLQNNGAPPKDISSMKPKDQVRALLQQNKSVIAAAIPKHLNPDRLMQVALMASNKNPALLECYVPTLVSAVVQCSAMGLEPNTVLGHAYLVPFNNKIKVTGRPDKWRKDVQVILGYKGLIDLARRSGQIQSIAAHAVRENDFFDFQYGIDEKLAHKPAMDNRGDIVAFYAIAHMKDGGYAFEVMSKSAIETIMKNTQSKGDYGPWKDHLEEMGRKTTIRRLAKFLPLSVELATAVRLDEQADAGEDQDLSSILEGEFSDDVDTTTREVLTQQPAKPVQQPTRQAQPQTVTEVQEEPVMQEEPPLADAPAGMSME